MNRETLLLTGLYGDLNSGYDRLFFSIFLQGSSLAQSVLLASVRQRGLLLRGLVTRLQLVPLRWL